MTAPDDQPLVTLIVTPRERFSVALAALQSVLENTHVPHRLVYVDGGSPSPVRRALAGAARQHEFRVIRTRHHLSPNQARNLGLRHSHTRYTVFIDNDVFVAPGWLEALVQCAEDTDAWVVSPLVCQGEPLHSEVHCAGGETGVAERFGADGATRRQLVERIRWQGRKVAQLEGQLRRERTGLAEYHCMLVRNGAFRRVGVMDELILSSKEHVDFCIRIQEAGGEIWLEPASVVTYALGSPTTLADHLYFMLRWSDDWEHRSLQRLREKYGLHEHGYLAQRLSHVGWRRRQYVLLPLVRRVGRGRGVPRLMRLLGSFERHVNRQLTARHARASAASVAHAAQSER